MADKTTLTIYDAKAKDYAELTKHTTKSPDLTSFIASLPKGASVLDLGCGPGLFAAAMSQAGLRVNAMDASLEMIKLASQQPGVTAWQATFEDLEGENAYDGIFANFSLLHAPRQDVPRHIKQIARMLRPNGVFHIGMKTGSGEERDEIGRHYCYFSQSELEDTLTSAGLNVFYRNQGSDIGLSGSMSDWVSLQARKGH